MTRPVEHPFDALAHGYDAEFTSSRIGQAQRRAVQRRLELAFRPPMRVLELGCGTGEDAAFLAERGVRVLATDVSEKMIEVARGKARERGLEGLIELRAAPMQEISCKERLDGAYSNFGALNCVEDLPALARRLADCLRPGAPVLLCVMGPCAAWEWGWFLARGEPRKALRRLRRGGVEWRGLRIQYPSARGLARCFEPWFEASRVGAVGALVPPSYAEGWAARHPRWLARLEAWERRLETLWPLPQLADHYLLELERR